MKLTSHWISRLNLIAPILLIILLSNATLARVSASPLADRSATYNTGGFTFGSTKQLLPTLPTQDIEPEIKVDLFGDIYITAIEGVPGGVDLWKSADKGNAFTYLGQPDGAQCPTPPTCVNDVGIGGGDDSIDVSSGGYLYVSSLWVGSTTMSSSTNGGFAPWNVNPVATGAPVVDRNWIAAYGPQTVYLSYRQTPGSNVIFVTKSTDAGKTFGAPVATFPATSDVLARRQGNLVVDQYNGNIYTSFRPQELNGHTRAELWFLKSTDGGATWSLSKAYQGPLGTDIGNVFPAMAVDRGGNIHIAFSRCDFNSTTAVSSNCQVWLISSSNQGSTWIDAVRVSNGPDSSTAVLPWIAAGSPGVVDITWYGSPAARPDIAADWHLFFAQTRNALAATPTFNQVQAIPQVVHNEDLCLKGGACGGNRDLAEYFTMTLDPDGNANIAFADDVNNSTFGLGLTWYTKQTSGASAFAPPGGPLPATFAANLMIEPGRTGREPNIKVDSHNQIYIAAIGVSGTGSGPGVWKSSDNGNSFAFKGKITNGPGAHGGDADIITIPSVTQPMTDCVYLSDLGITTIHISKSTDGNTFPPAPVPANEASASADRMWFAYDVVGSTQVLYQVDHELASELVRVSRSVNDGAWLQFNAITDQELVATTLPNTNPGTVFVDKSNHNVYTVFAASTNQTNAMQPPFGKLLNIWDAVSTNNGANYVNYPVFKGLVDSPVTATVPVTTYGTTTGNIFAIGDIDSAGNIYVAWSMNSARTNTFDIWYAFSRDQGKNFYGPIQVSQNVGSQVFPWLVAGSDGRVDIVWYGTSTVGDPNRLPASAQWNVFFAQSANAHDREPVFTQVQAGDHVMHNGAISTGGLTGSADRSLLDFFQVALDRNGMAHIAYADNGNNPGSATANVAYAKQTSGASAGTPPLPAGCQTFPTAVTLSSFSARVEELLRQDLALSGLVLLGAVTLAGGGVWVWRRWQVTSGRVVR